jgi:hypothetical protein
MSNSISNFTEPGPAAGHLYRQSPPKLAASEAEVLSAAANPNFPGRDQATR